MRLAAAVFLVLLIPAIAIAGPLEDGKAAYERHDYKTAIKLWLPLAQQGDPKAQFNIGLSYVQGKGVKKDYAEAAKLFRKAANQGNAEAQVILGKFYVTGQGVPKDDAEAMKWYRMAAQQGNPDAQKQLGVMYEEGDGVPKDAVEAEKWFRKAVIGTREKAEHGDPEAQANLGTMYYKGMGLPKDNDEAEKWYRKAAAQGNKYAQFQLDTIAWVQNYGKTIKAAKQGDPEAQEKLGEFYTFVDAGPEQLAEAANWFRKAAEQGSPKGQKTLGFLYYKGQGVPQDYSEAYFWNMLAVAAGEKESAEESSAIAAHLTPEQIAAEDKRIRAWKPTPAQPPAPAETTGAPDTK